MSFKQNTTARRKKTVVCFFIIVGMYLGLLARLLYLMILRGPYYEEKANLLHERERSIKAPRGIIYDRNGIELAGNRSVCTISVVFNQMTDRDKVTQVLCKELGLDREYVEKKVNTYSSIERIKSNVDSAIGQRIRAYELPGVKVDEDYKRFYPHGELASKVLGFTGSDNQGILGLEVKYENYLKGIEGEILSTTDAKGIEVKGQGERRKDAVPGNNLYLSLDYNIQTYATQLAYQAMEAKEATQVQILVMNPQNGEIYAMVNVPEYDLNHPFALENEADLNQIWRNPCINDTYEPGSTFKMVTAAAALEAGKVKITDQFSCPGYIVVGDRKIRCHKVGGHGSEDFVKATMNSCNPVFVTVGLRMGVDTFYQYFQQFGLLEKTGIDLPGEAGIIMHKPENMGDVELATVSFGQSFQVTPILLMTTAAAIVNGGNRVTPHFGVKSVDPKTGKEDVFSYPIKTAVLSKETSETMREILEMVVKEGGGQKGQVEGYRIGGKTATSQMLPRNSGNYIASFIGFAPANDPKVMAMAIIHKPKGVYYGGQIAAPVVRQLFENILPYLGIMEYNQ